MGVKSRVKGARSAFGNLTKEYVHNSECFVSIIEDGDALQSCYIEFRGECANTPSLKNARRRYSLEYGARCRLQAMSELFTAELAKMGKAYIQFGEQPVAMLLVCGKRGSKGNRSFDVQGCIETIADWLEPATKKGGNGVIRERGWGVGLIHNDSQVRPSAYKAADFGQDTEATTIIVRPFESVRRQTTEFVMEFFLPQSARKTIEDLK